MVSLPLRCRARGGRGGGGAGARGPGDRRRGLSQRPARTGERVDVRGARGGRLPAPARRQRAGDLLPGTRATAGTTAQAPRSVADAARLQRQPALLPDDAAGARAGLRAGAGGGGAVAPGVAGAPAGVRAGRRAAAHPAGRRRDGSPRLPGRGPGPGRDRAADGARVERGRSRRDDHRRRSADRRRRCLADADPRRAVVAPHPRRARAPRRGPADRRRAVASRSCRLPPPAGARRPRRGWPEPARQRRAGVRARGGVDAARPPRSPRGRGTAAAGARAGRGRGHEHAPRPRNRRLRVAGVLRPLRRTGHPRLAGLHVRQPRLPRVRRRLHGRRGVRGARHPGRAGRPALPGGAVRRQRGGPTGGHDGAGSRAGRRPALPRAAPAPRPRRRDRGAVRPVDAVGGRPPVPHRPWRGQLLRRRGLSAAARGRAPRRGQVRRRVPGLRQRA